MATPQRPASVFARLEGRLLSDEYRAELLREHGEGLAAHVDAVVSKRAKEYTLANAETLAKALNPNPDPDLTTPFLVSPDEAAFMLGCHRATIERLVVAGALPEPTKIIGRRIGHRLEDIKAYADRESKPLTPLPKATKARQPKKA